MRVVLLTHNYPRDPADLAGAFLVPLATGLRDRGHDVRVVAPSDAGRGGTDRLDGIIVRRVRYGSAGRERYAYTGRMAEAVRSPAGWLALARLHRGLRAAARDEAGGVLEAVVHAHWWFPAGLAAPPEVPTVVTLHGTDGRLLAVPGASWLARRALTADRLVTAVSTRVAAAVSKATGRRPDQVPVQPMPVRLAAIPRVSRGGGGIVVVARLTAQKRVHLAIEAHRQLLQSRPDLVLTIIGDGPERPRLERLAAGAGSESRIRWLGRLAPADVAAAIGDADVSVLPARDEGLGLTAVESLLVGVPVVGCRDGGGVLDILAEPGAGRIAEPTATAVALALAALLDDPAARAGAVAAGTRWRARLDPAVVAERFEGWYHQVRRDPLAPRRERGT